MDKSSALHQFLELTQAPSAVAESILARNNWVLDRALDDFYNGGTQSASGSSDESMSPQPQMAAAQPPKQKKQQKKSMFKSFSELAREDADDDDDEKKNYYAGGGRGSALNVENPDEPKSLVDELLRKAETGEGGRPPSDDDDDEGFHKPSFTGVGYQLGSSTEPSRTVGTPEAPPQREGKALRKITFWKDGFQVGEGRLYRYDDPGNAKYLAELNAGRAPLELLDVKMGQDVDVAVEKKLDEEYTPPKRKLGGFFGAGQRLGSPVSPNYVSPSPQPAEQEPQQEEKREEVEEPKGDAQVQIRLADGRRVIRRVMSTAPVQELYDFVELQTPEPRAWTLNFAFPVQPITNKEQSIKEAGLVNAVVVQRWA